MITARIPLIALSLAFVSGLCAQAPLLQDDFEGTSINSALWRVTLPFSNPPPSTAAETNGNLVLFRRAVLDSRGTFEGSLDIQGRFRFTGENDALSIVFRSDLTVTNQVERRGVQAALQESTGKVFLIPEPFTSTPTSGVFLIAKNQDVTFRITDNGDLVRLYLDDLFLPLMSVTITNRRGSHVSLYNSLNTAGRAQVDRFSIHPLQTCVFIDNKLTHEGPVRKSTAVQVKLQPYYTNSLMFYTLDGSEPSFIGTEYTGPFTLGASATLRAISYRADFLESVESPAIEVQVLPDVVLTNETPGGGIVQFDPPGPVYSSNTVVSMVAMPAPGWQFVRWEGAASGTTVSNMVVMTNHLAVRAVFGTVPALSVIGSGQIQSYPAGPVQAYGSKVRLMGLPSPGSYFFRWANGISGNSSPGTLTVTNAAPGVSALFSALAANQVSLTAQLDGAGTIALAPAMNVFTNGQQVALLGVPDPGHLFLGWAGDAAGVTNPTTLFMDGNKTVTARFGPAVQFRPEQSELGSGGFQLSMKSQAGLVFGLQASSNLLEWAPVATLTNSSGSLLYLHADATNWPTLFYRAVEP